MIEVEEIGKRYGATVAVDTASFRVRPGLVTGFLGPNGAGKSTTMRLLVGLDRPTTGRARIDGVPYRELTHPLRRVGALLEARTFHGGRGAYHHLLWLAQTNRIPKTRVREVLGMVGLEDVAGQRTKGFSLGMAQRLGIATALLGDPPVLLFDEPVNGLDPQGVVWIRNLMRSLAAEGRTVFVSSHLMSEMALTADHLIVIGKGRILADAGLREFVAANSGSGVRLRTSDPEPLRRYLAEAGIRADWAPDGALDVYAEAPAVQRIATARGVPIHEIGRRPGSLEEAFMRLTGSTVEYRGEGTHG